MTRRPLLLTLLLLLPAAILLAQTDNPAIGQLRQRRAGLQQRITQSEALLKTTTDDARSQLDALAALNSQVEERKRYIQALGRELDTLDNELRRLEQRIGRLKNELKQKQERYAASVRYLQQHRPSIQEKLLFIFSADGPGQMYRRLRYVREYADYQRRQGEDIARQRKQIDQRHAQMLKLRETKGALLKDREQEMRTLQAKEQEVFCDTVSHAGYDPMIYSNMEWMAFTLDMEELSEYDFWYADYSDIPQCPYDYKIWQYSESGVVPGINANVDLNLWFREEKKQ